MGSAMPQSFYPVRGMSDVLIVGGGVIGLSLAYELAGHGAAVRVIDAGQPAREASWAGAGILPPARATSGDPLEQLTALSNDLHRQWSEALRATTGIDNEYRRSGAIYLARDPEETYRLREFAAQARGRDIVADELSAAKLHDVEPALCPADLAAAYLVPEECQLRNPRHLKALLGACVARDVKITAGAAAHDVEIRGDRITAVRTSVGALQADQVCLTAGAWSAALAERWGVTAAIKPIRGQIVLLATPRPVLARIINEGARYLVPRRDGRLLVGSTEEDAGFDRSTTAGAIGGLLEFALGLAPQLAAAQIERSWAGLRPCTGDGLPYLGRVPHLDNAFVAAGHFRGGLQLSPGTAVVMSQLMRGERPAVDLHAFRVDRHATQRRAEPRGSQQPVH